MLWCHPDLLFVTSPLICPRPQVFMDEDSEKKSSLELAFTEELPPWGKLIVRDYSWDQCGEHTVAWPPHLDQVDLCRVFPFHVCLLKITMIIMLWNGTRSEKPNERQVRHRDLAFGGWSHGHGGSLCPVRSSRSMTSKYLCWTQSQSYIYLKASVPWWLFWQVRSSCPSE